MKKPRSSESKLAIGRVGAPKGVRGDLKIQSYSGETAHFMGLSEVELAAPDNPARKLRLKVLRIETSGGALTMAFEGYPSPEAARALTGLDIVVGREGAAPLREGEWYVDDLIGLRLVAEGETLAEVVSVVEGGPEPWLEVKRIGGADRRDAEGVAKRNSVGVSLVPFRKEFVGAVDLDSGTIELLAPWILE